MIDPGRSGNLTHPLAQNQTFYMHHALEFQTKNNTAKVFQFKSPALAEVEQGFFKLLVITDFFIVCMY
jgi:hypothetical protein